MFKQWVIDATHYNDEDGILCFCPIQMFSDGDFSIIAGMNLLGDLHSLPEDAELVGIVHEGGDEAVEKWCEDHVELFQKIERRAKGA